MFTSQPCGYIIEFCSILPVTILVFRFLGMANCKSHILFICGSQVGKFDQQADSNLHFTSAEYARESAERIGISITGLSISAFILQHIQESQENFKPQQVSYIHCLLKKNQTKHLYLYFMKTQYLFFFIWQYIPLLVLSVGFDVFYDNNTVYECLQYRVEVTHKCNIFYDVVFYLLLSFYFQQKIQLFFLIYVSGCCTYWQRFT